MEEEYETMWSQEHKISKHNLKKENALQKITENSRLTGLTENVPYNLRGIKINPRGADPETILVSAGYRRNGNRGWVRWIDPLHRFHAYVLTTGKLMIHCDLIKKGKHIASEEGCKEEKARIKKNFIPLMEDDKKSRFYRKSEQTLPLAEQKRLLAELKKNNEPDTVLEVDLSA